MSTTVELPDELADALSRRAARLGMSLPDYAAQLLSAACTSDKEVRTGADLVAYWQAEGLVGTRPDIIDSQDHARRFREQAERRPG